MPKPRTPLLSVDVVIALEGRPGSVVLIERRHEPHGWALPGGFVDIGETVEQAATREMLEETGLEVRLSGVLGVYSAADRDPRGHTVSIVFAAEAAGAPRAGDDAGRVQVFEYRALPQLAFDHADILRDYVHWRESGVAPGLVPSKGKTR